MSTKHRTYYVHAWKCSFWNRIEKIFKMPPNRGVHHHHSERKSTKHGLYLKLLYFSCAENGQNQGKKLPRQKGEKYNNIRNRKKLWQRSNSLSQQEDQESENTLNPPLCTLWQFSYCLL